MESVAAIALAGKYQDANTERLADFSRQALVVGRPPVFMAEYLDCHVPTALEGIILSASLFFIDPPAEHFYYDGKVPLGCMYIALPTPVKDTDMIQLAFGALIFL